MTPPPPIARCLALLAVAASLGCSAAASPDEDGSTGPDNSHLDQADFVPFAGDGKGDETSATFDRHDVVSDDFFTEQSLSADALQQFLEQTPYGRRSWLADERVDDERVADALHATGSAYGINPVVLLARLQAEQGLVSKSARPSQHRVDRAFGCGCPDGSGCGSSYLGFGRQLECAAQTMKKLYDASVDGTGYWRKKRARTTLDGLRVTPKGHATAAMYAYTPWVLPNRGGNWLVWNVTRKYYKYFLDADLVVPPAFVGDTCTASDQCSFTSNGQFGYCHQGPSSTNGVCGIPCEGYCTDKSGFAVTFCAELGPTFGVCLPKAGPKNNGCASLPGTKPTQVIRYVGQSGAPPVSAEVCLPE